MKPAPARNLRTPLAVLASLTSTVVSAQQDQPAQDSPPPLHSASLSLKHEPEPPLAPAPPPRPRFGDAHSRWWTIGGGVADDFTTATDINLYFDYSYFLVKDVEFLAELDTWYFNQAGDNAFGAGPSIIFRWHFINRDHWTVYADAGIGLLFTTSAVPEGGTDFDFTPRLGFGVTRSLTEDDAGARLVLGLRWHHISNARINGDAENPSRDGLMLYGGVQWPF